MPKAVDGDPVLKNSIYAADMGPKSCMYILRVGSLPNLDGVGVLRAAGVPYVYGVALMPNGCVG